jgi:ParB-like chromosome segregation protein Spo0J
VDTIKKEKRVPENGPDPTHIKDLVPDPKNRRKHTPRNVGMIVDALHKVGAGRSIVIDENNEVLAGNATLEAAGEAGITDLRVIEAKGSELVAVRRTGLSEAQKRDLALYDNRTGELAEWDVDQLLKDVEAGIDLSALFSDDELHNLLADAEHVSKVIADGVSEGLEYRVIVECRDERHQMELLERFREEKVPCRALIS